LVRVAVQRLVIYFTLISFITTSESNVSFSAQASPYSFFFFFLFFFFAKQEKKIKKKEKSKEKLNKYE